MTARRAVKRGRFRSGAALAAATLLIPAALFAALEILCRRGASVPEPFGDPRHVRIFRPFFHVEKRSGVRLVTNPSQHIYQLQEFPLRKEAGVRRLIVIGESSASRLGVALQRVSTPRIEVFNCGLGGSSLEEMEMIFDEILGYRPDAIIVLFGHNLMFQHKSPRPFQYRLGGWAGKSRVIARLARRLRHAPPLAPTEDRLRAWERFLRRTARKCKAKEVRLFVCALQGNLWFPPMASPNEREDPAFLESIFLWNSGRRTAAIETLAARLRDRPAALLHFQLAAWLYERRSYAEAFDEFRSAADREPKASRVHSATNAIARRLAAEGAFALLDFEDYFDRHGRHGVPGWDLFHDNCHAFDTIPLAKICFQALGWPARDTRGEPLSPDGPDCVKRAGWLVENAPTFPKPWAHALAYWIPSLLERGRPLSRKELDDAVTAAQPSEGADPGAARATVFLAIAEGFARGGRWDAAFYFNDRAASLNPAWPEVWVQRGLFELQRRRPARARACFRKALDIDPRNAEAGFFAGRMERA